MLRRSKSLLPRLVSLSQSQSTAAAQSILDTSTPLQDERKHFSGAGSPLNSIIREYSTQIATTSSGLPPTVHAAKHPTPAIQYDEHTHERFVPGDPSKRAFTYFVLTGGRFIYASALRLAVLKFILSMTATKDVLAMASLEVDLTKIEPGNTITVKWRGKPVFIKRRTDEDIETANNVDLKTLRDPQSDYDTSGRARKGPAPYNLEVPEYSFLDESTLKVG